MTKQQVVARLAERLGVPKRQAAKAVDALFSTSGIFATELRRGGKVQISGFGLFETRTRAARPGRDPRTGRTIAIKSSLAPVFRPGKPLRDLLNRRRT